MREKEGNIQFIDREMYCSRFFKEKLNERYRICFYFWWLMFVFRVRLLVVDFTKLGFEIFEDLRVQGIEGRRRVWIFFLGFQGCRYLNEDILL